MVGVLTKLHQVAAVVVFFQELEVVVPIVLQMILDMEVTAGLPEMLVKLAQMIHFTHISVQVAAVVEAGEPQVVQVVHQVLLLMGQKQEVAVLVVDQVARL